MASEWQTASYHKLLQTAQVFMHPSGQYYKSNHWGPYQVDDKYPDISVCLCVEGCRLEVLWITKDSHQFMCEGPWEDDIRARMERIRQTLIDRDDAKAKELALQTERESARRAGFIAEATAKFEAMSKAAGYCESWRTGAKGGDRGEGK
jgi:hypothetical protein